MKKQTKFVTPSKLIFDWIESQLMIDNKTCIEGAQNNIYSSHAK